MGKETKNVFRLAREELGLSRASATKYIPKNPEFPGMGTITENKLAKLEMGTNPIYPDDVVEMAKRYNKPELRNYYCCNECAIGKLDTPEVALDSSVHEILVSMAVSLKNVNHKKIRLMEILEDGTLSKSEEAEFDLICEELDKISMTVEALQLWCEKAKIRSEK